MKNIALAIALAAASFASGIETRFVKIATTNDVNALCAIPEWCRGVDTNGITVTVCVGMADVAIGGGRTGVKVPISRDLTFDAEGRLVRASKIGLMREYRHSDTASGELLSMVDIDNSPSYRRILELQRRHEEESAQKSRVLRGR